MLEEFRTATVSHAVGPRFRGHAAHQVISATDFEAAQQEIIGWSGYKPTPLIGLRGLSSALSIETILYKDEGSRFGLGSFKALGGSYAVYRVLQREISKEAGHTVPMKDIGKHPFAEIAARTTVISATDGNHGRSVAWGAQRLGMPCRIYIHAEVSEERAEAITSLGAKVIRIAGNYDDSVELTRKDAQANDWFIVSDTSWEGYTEIPREVMAGYGVMANEVIQTLERPPTHVFLQGGVGGLAASMAAAFRQHWGESSPRVIVVEPELAPCLLVSAKEGRATIAPISKETLMAGLSCGEPSELAWKILEEEASDFLTIPENVVGPTMRLLANSPYGDPGLEVGESAIAGLAGFICSASQQNLRSKTGLTENSRVLLIGTEGVTDGSLFNQLTGAADP